MRNYLSSSFHFSFQTIISGMGELHLEIYTEVRILTRFCRLYRQLVSTCYCIVVKWTKQESALSLIFSSYYSMYTVAFCSFGRLRFLQRNSHIADISTSFAFYLFFVFFLVNYVEERPWWPTKPQQRKKEESKRLRGELRKKEEGKKLRGEGDQIKFMNLILKWRRT